MIILKTNITPILLSLLISTVVYIILALVGGYISLDYKLVVGCISYFFGVLIILNIPKFPNKLFAFLLVFSFPFFIFIFFNVFRFKDTWISFPSSLFICVGAIGGLLFYKKRSFIVPVGIIFLIVCWFEFFSKPFYNKFTYNTYDGTVLFKQPQLNFFDSTATPYLLNNPDKYYILDFWTSSCGVCFRKFPSVDSINNITDKAKFEIIAVNIPIREEKKEDNFKILDPFNFKFTKLFADITNTADSFGITGYPTTVVIKNNQVIFRGDFDDAVKRFKVVDKL